MSKADLHKDITSVKTLINYLKSRRNRAATVDRPLKHGIRIGLLEVTTQFIHRN